MSVAFDGKQRPAPTPHTPGSGGAHIGTSQSVM
jgi:hypothetical protein